MNSVQKQGDVVGGPENGQAVKVALLGNPNTGKTTLFNVLSGLRHKTSNFPGTTQEARIGTVLTAAGRAVHLVDLPGIYSIEIDQPESEVCRQVLAGRASPAGERAGEPDVVCVVLDATNLSRNLVIAGEALRRRLPTVVVINMIDLAHRAGLRISTKVLSERLGCTVLAVSARSGEHTKDIVPALLVATVPNRTPPGGQAALEEWAEEIAAEAIVAAPACDDTEAEGESGPSDEELEARRQRTDRIDAALVHPIAGTFIFILVAAGIFWLIFSLASYPMEWIDSIFGVISSKIAEWMPAGIVSDLLSGGVVNGVAGVVVFVPQIALLFFVISLLEDTGYLARAAFLMDRVLRPFGLPGHAFVPLLSSHACAIPGIIATRSIPDKRERIAAILAAPFMTCSARLPVYVLVTSVLFPGRPALAALAFIGCYALGIIAGLASALIFRKTILKGRGRPMAMELPSYKMPSIRTALLTAYDRVLVFLKKAGTNILAISIVLWWLGAFPRVAPPQHAVDLQAQALVIREAQPLEAEKLESTAQELIRSNAKRESMIGHLGRFTEPVFRPLGYDWQLSIGVLCSFAAREVFVSTMAVVVTGHEDAGEAGVMDRLASAKRDDGTAVFSTAASWSLLVFFVLAMQCMSTLVTTAREAGSWKWAALQLVWSTGWAYLLAMLVYMAFK